jgi:hypothetical protein
VADGLLTIDYQGMTRIVPALKPNDEICLGCEKVNHLAFAFITPLCSHDHYIGHFCPPKLGSPNPVFNRSIVAVFQFRGGAKI